jgi:hypothetical protein
VQVCKRRTTNEKFFLLFLSGLVVKSTCLNDLVIDIELVSSALVHGFLNTLLCYKSQDEDSFCLADTMGTILGLEISVRIPVEL